MNLILVESYKFPELGADAKERVIEWLNEYSVEAWKDSESDYWLPMLKEMGYSDIDFQYSGFHTQGDGASIVCRVDVKRFIQRNKLGNRFGTLYNVLKADNVDGVQILRRRWGNYAHDNLLYAEASDFLRGIDTVEELEEHSVRYVRATRQAEEVIPCILEEVKERSRAIYKDLEAENDYRYTEEYAVDMCEANGYLFDVYGKPVHHLQAKAKVEAAAE